jgi:outer membrane receptor protein involved in Fe transport
MQSMKATLIALLGVLAGLAAAGHSQSVLGSINGTVLDPSRKPVPAATVAVISEETGRSRSAATNEDGWFRVTLLPAGSYRVEVERSGFAKSTQTVTLEVNQQLRVETVLVTGAVAQEVTVTAARALLKTDSASISGVIDNVQITGLPLDGRNFAELALLLPGVLPPALGSAGTVRGDFAASINGARDDANSFLLDGVDNGDPKLNGIAVNPPVDAIREFEVLTNGYDASFGRHGGGQVNVVLRSGGNKLHGAVYEFFRNAALDARNFFALGSEPEPKYQRNQFGASVGGPLRRDHTFFFLDYEGRRVREGITRATNVPTAAEREGDFSQSFRAPVNPFTQQPFPGNRIPAQFQHPAGQALARLYPLPNRSVPGQNYVSSPTLRDRDDHFDVRLDTQLARSNDLSVRYSFVDRDLYEPFAGPTFAAVPGFGNNVPRRAQNLMLGDVHSFSPSFLNELRLGFTRVAAGVFQETAVTNASAGIPAASRVPRDAGLSFTTITGYSALGQEYNAPIFGATNSYQLVDQATWARGNHQVKFGFDFRYLQQNAFRDVQARGFLSFLGVYTQHPLADVLLGLPTFSGAARLDNPQHLRAESYGFFVQHSYRARPDLTLTAGLRYELVSPPVDHRDRASVYNPATGALAAVGSAGIPRAGYQADRNNLAPRVGFAWNPRCSPTCRGVVVRGGYGIFYDQAALAPGEGLYFNQPYFDLRFFFPVQGVYTLTLTDPFPAQFPIPSPASAFTYQRDLRTAYVQHWNFSVQYPVNRTRVLEVNYAGSKGTKLLGARDINQPNPAPPDPRGFPNLRPNPLFADIDIAESRANSTYHSLQTRFQQRLSGGLALLGSYTFGKALDDTSNFFTSAGDPNFPQDSRNLRAERGRSNFDARQRLVLSYTWDIPVATKSRMWGGWQTHGIWTFQTGRPFTVALLPDLDNSNTGRSNLGFGNNDRPNRVAHGKLSNPSPDRWFDTAAFVISAPGTFGNSGRNILDGPGLQSFNVSLMKNTALAEATTLQLRFEAFNLFNRANFDLPDIFVGSPTFGRISSAQSPRRLQFGLKLLF